MVSKYTIFIRTCIIISLTQLIDQFRYIKIQPQTIDLSTRLWGLNTEFVGVYSPEPRSEVCCLRLKFNISKLVYYSMYRCCCFHSERQSRISLVIEAEFFKLGTRNVHLKRNQMTPIVSLPWKLSWAPFSLCQKPNILIFYPLKWDKGSCLEQTWFPYCLISRHQNG